MFILERETGEGSAMPCIDPDGFLTRSGELILLALMAPATPEEAADETGLPLFRVRGGVREFLKAGFVLQEGHKYNTTPAGIKKIEGRD